MHRTAAVNIAARAAAACAALSLVLASAGEFPAVSGRWRVDADASTLRVLVFRGGLLGALGHNHVVAHRAIAGCASLGDSVADSRVRLSLPAAAFEVDNEADRRAAGERFPVPVPADDIAATRRNMLGPRLLDAVLHDVIELGSVTIRGDWPSLEIDFAVDIAGRRRSVSLPVTVTVDGERLAAAGSHEISHRDLGLKPFSAALGTLRVSDRLEFRYEIVLAKTAPGSAASDCERALAVVDDDGVPVPDDGAE